MDMMSIKYIMVIGCIAYSLGVLLASQYNDFNMFLLSYGLLSGIGYGMLYISPLKLAWAYFPTKKGAVSGTISAFLSLGSIFFVFYAK